MMNWLQMKQNWIITSNFLCSNLLNRQFLDHAKNFMMDFKVVKQADPTKDTEDHTGKVIN